MAICWHFMVEMYLNNMFNTFNSFIDFSASEWYNKNPDFIILEARNSTFPDFLVFEPVTKPQNQHYLFLETPGHLTKTKKNPRFFFWKIVLL